MITTIGFIAIITFTIGLLVLLLGKGKVIPTLIIEYLILFVLMIVDMLFENKLATYIHNYKIIMSVEIGILLIGILINTIFMMKNKDAYHS